MDIKQQQDFSQALRQEQKPTYQQIQAIELLFLPVLELQTMIDEELSKNPVLEIEEDNMPDTISQSEDDDDEWLDKVLQLDEDNRYIKSRYSTYSKDDEEKRRHFLESVASEQTFQESLIEQLRFLDLDKDMYSCCEVVISGLDNDGYLTSHPADLAMASGQTMDMIRKAIEIVKTLEPAGVGAENLKERLLIQLERKDMKETLVYIAVRDYLDKIANNHLPEVAKKMDISIDEVKDIITEIQKLSPRIVGDTVKPHEYVYEEVSVIEEDGELKVKLRNDFLPNLYISPYYKKLVKEDSVSDETKTYIKEKIRSGAFMINMIIQRQITIKKIAASIVKYQEDFFRKGIEHLKPLKMADIARECEIHETTVSRCVAAKYLKCKHGIFPMKYFFSSGYHTEDGQGVSQKVIKQLIKEIIDNENKTKPLSDSAIAEILEKKGYNVARRTVAKYRESMNILSSNLRREY